MNRTIFHTTAVITVAGALFGAQVAGETIKLSPEKVVELAKTQSVAVRISGDNLNSMAEAKKAAFTGLLPTLSGSASAMHIIDKATFEIGGGGGGPLTLSPAQEPYRPIIEAIMSGFSNMKIETPDNMYNVGLTLAWPLFTGGRILNSYRMAGFSLSAQEWTHQRMLKEISLSALQLFWLYVNSLKQLEALRETGQWFETVIADQQKMFEQGLIIELDVLNSRIQLDNTKLGQCKLENGLATLGGQILLFLNLPPDGRIEADTAALALPVGTFAAPGVDSVANLLNKREDVMALLNQIEALRAVKKIQAAAYVPTVSAVGNFAYTNQYSTVDWDMKKNSMAGVSCNWNIFDWGKNLHDKKGTEYKIRILETQLDNLRSQIRLKIRELGRKVEECLLVCEIARKDLEISRKALDIAKKKYDAQAITNTELLLSRNQLTAKTVGYAQARINVILAIEEYNVAAIAPAGSSGGTGMGN
jgi:outer membrane protein